MIDYEKLKEAESMIRKHKLPMSLMVGISTHIETPPVCISLVPHYDKMGYGFDNFDDLVTKLKTLTQPEPKYKQGDIVWMVINGEPVSRIILKNAGPKYYLEGHVGLIYESELYPTKSQLIEAQIEYWSSMKIEEDGCHENGFSHKWNHTHYQYREPVHFDTNEYKCPKCHEIRFYDGMCWVAGCDYKEPEYCNVSGAKLGKREPDGATGCEHETDRMGYEARTREGVEIMQYKCTKCGEFYP